MNGITINIDPVMLHLGAFQLRWYGLAIITAILAAILISARRAKNRGLSPDAIYELAIWVVAGGILGARIFHVIDRWDLYSAHPAAIFQIQQGGLAIWGALAGGGLVLLLFTRIKRLSLGRIADIIVPGLLVAQMIGRIGCIINGDAYGAVTTLPWAFIYVHPDAAIPAEFFGLLTHPYPVYEIIWNAISLVVLLKAEKSFRRGGQLFLAYLGLYSLGRFAFTFVRQESRFLWGLQQAQLIALLGIVVSIVLFTYFSYRERIKEAVN